MDRYSVASATEQLDTARTNIGNELAGLKRDRQKIGQSIFDLQESTKTMTGKFAKARSEELLQTNRDRMKDVEKSMSKLEADREALTVSSFLGDSQPPDKKLRRSQMDDKAKLDFIKQHNMSEYKSLQY